MPLYDKDSLCPKCGEAGASVRWVESSEIRAAIASQGLHSYPGQPPGITGGRLHTPPTKLVPEHIKRTCGHCTYAWMEVPLDGKLAAALGEHK